MDFPGKSTGVGCHCLLRLRTWGRPYYGEGAAQEHLWRCTGPTTPDLPGASHKGSLNTVGTRDPLGEEALQPPVLRDQQALAPPEFDSDVSRKLHTKLLEKAWVPCAQRDVKPLPLRGRRAETPGRQMRAERRFPRLPLGARWGKAEAQGGETPGSHIAGRCFTIWTTREAQLWLRQSYSLWFWSLLHDYIKEVPAFRKHMLENGDRVIISARCFQMVKK